MENDPGSINIAAATKIECADGEVNALQESRPFLSTNLMRERHVGAPCHALSNSPSENEPRHVGVRPAELPFSTNTPVWLAGAPSRHTREQRCARCLSV